MNTEVAERPAVEPATLKETALASFVPIEKHLRALAGRYADVAFDVATPRGFNAAKIARQELREDGRYAVQRLEKRLRDEANDLKRTVADEAERLIAIVQPVEASVQAQIDVEEARREAVAEAKRQAAAEAARIEAERVQRHRDNIATIRLYLAKAQGLPAERILRGMDLLNAVSVGHGFEEFADEALRAKIDTLQAMRELYDRTAAAEQEAARIEFQRAENERVAAELAAQKRMQALEAERLAQAARDLAAARAEAERVADEQIRQAQVRQFEADMAAARAASPVDQSTGEILTNTQEGPVPGTPGPCASNTAEAAAVPSGSEGTVAPAEVRAAEPAQVAEPLTLSAIGLRLGFAVTQAFLARIGVQPTSKVKAAVLYDAALWPTIKAALVKHVEGLA